MDTTLVEMPAARDDIAGALSNTFNAGAGAHREDEGPTFLKLTDGSAMEIDMVGLGEIEAEIEIAET